MPTEMETRMMQLLSAIEVPDNAPEYIQSLGNEAVTVICEAALGSYPGIRRKVRMNAVALVGRMNHPQALEAMPLLLSDPDTDVSIRAMRATGRKRDKKLVEQIARVLQQPHSSAILAAEALDALLHIDSPEARLHVKSYAATSPGEFAHRSSQAVEQTLQAVRKNETHR